MEITQEQIEQLKEVGNEKTKELLNEWFGIKIEPHVWYYWEECSSSYVFAYSNVERNEVYGFINSDCFGYSLLKPRIDFRLATKEEVEPLLISEAKKRGIKPLVKIVASATFAQDPKYFTTAPAGAIKKAWLF